MTPIQQLMLGVGASKKTYLDDVFSPYVYIGTGSSLAINNGINLSGEGGMTWVKKRGGSTTHSIVDSVRGNGKMLQSSSTDAEIDNSGYAQNLSSNGFTLPADWSTVNTSGDTYTSWSFRKVPGFFDVVTYTGTGSSVLTLSHDLGSVPGIIIIKRLDGAASDWIVYHRSTGISNYLKLNSTNAAADDTGDYLFNNVAPTATHFTIGAGHDAVNANTNNYIAYLFAGGESTAAEAVSVKFDGDGDYLSFSDSDTAPGSGAFTLECWIKPDTTHTDSNYRRILRTGDNNATGSLALVWNSSSNRISVNYNNTTLFTTTNNVHRAHHDQWTHLALVREGTGSNQTKLYLNGLKVKEGTMAQDLTLHAWQIGTDSTLNATNFSFNGLISNVRLVVGTAVYTSSFRPTTKPLTNITNTKFLCCNNSSTTGKTVGPTITANGNVAANTDSPFDDPAGFVFGETGDQNVIKCGSYRGNGDASYGVEIDLGWEPQWILIKNTDLSTEQWFIFDHIRGIFDGKNDYVLEASRIDAENNYTLMKLTPTGFKLDTDDDKVNGDGHDYSYVAIRRPDGYVGKPAEAGTDAFALDVGDGTSTAPAFDSNFPVDFGMLKTPASTGHWQGMTRLTGIVNWEMNSSRSGEDYSGFTFDYNDGFIDPDWSSSYQAWMWKRHSGFDVVTYRGDEVAGREIPHSLNKIPEMMWVKYRNDSKDWRVYHKGMNGGTNPEQYGAVLNDDALAGSGAGYWNNTAPTATHFTVGDNNNVNEASGLYFALLFSTVPGISKVGYHTVSGAGNVTLSMDFSPRFLILKNISTASQPWVVIDTLRGINPNNANTPTMNLNSNGFQSNYTWIDTISSSGIIINGGQGTRFSNDGDNFIWYAHA